MNMTKERYLKILQMLNLRQKDLYILMDQVNKPHNLSAILRTCDAVGVMNIYAAIPSNENNISFKAKLFDASSGSAYKWLDVKETKNALEIVKTLQNQGVQVITTHLSQKSIDYREIDYTLPTCIVFGAEKYGVSDELAEQCDKNIIIPMQGMVQSLNVSVAAAIILFEAQAQRLRSGQYDKPSLSEAEIDKLLFEFSYPELAKEYQLENKPYPKIDENGQII